MAPMDPPLEPPLDVIICRTPISSKLQKIQRFKDHFKANVLCLMLSIMLMLSKLCSYTGKKTLSGDSDCRDCKDVRKDVRTPVKM